MRPTFPNLPGLPSKYLHSKFLPRSAHSPERFLIILSCQIDEVLPGLELESDDIQPWLQKGLLVL